MIRIFALAAAIFLGLAAQSAWALSITVAVSCFPAFAPMADVLLDQYGELPSAEMLAKNGNAIHLFVAPDEGTWTIVSTDPDGETCTLGYGTDFQPLGLPKPEPAGELH